MKRIQILTVILLACAMVAHADQRSTLDGKYTTSLTIETHATAREQIAYARSILSEMAATPPGWQRVTLATKARIALEVVPQRWPSDIRSVGVAYVLAARTLADENLLPQAVSVCDAAEKALGEDASAAIAKAVKGTALMRLNRGAEADEAFSAATRGAAFSRLNDVEKLDVLNRAAQYYEFAKEYSRASQLIREAARYSQSPVHRAGMLLRSLDANERGGDAKEANADAKAIESALREAHARTLSSGEMVALKAFEESLDRHNRERITR